MSSWLCLLFLLLLFTYQALFDDSPGRGSWTSPSFPPIFERRYTLCSVTAREKGKTERKKERHTHTRALSTIEQRDAPNIRK